METPLVDTDRSHEILYRGRMWRRILFAGALGVVVVAYVTALGLKNPEFVSDFDQVWAGARALWDGRDPYSLIGPGREFAWKWPLYYPLPALVAVAPLGLLPVIAARALFAGASAALLAWAITRDGWSRLPIFLSVSFMVTMEPWKLCVPAAPMYPEGTPATPVDGARYSQYGRSGAV